MALLHSAEISPSKREAIVAWLPSGATSQDGAWTVLRSAELELRLARLPGVAILEAGS